MAQIATNPTIAKSEWVSGREALKPIWIWTPIAHSLSDKPKMYYILDCTEGKT